MKFEIYKDKRNEWRWRLKARNGKIVAVGESYKSKASIKQAIWNVRMSGQAKVIYLNE